MNDPTEYALNEMNALTDTGTSCIIGPSTEVNSIRNWILEQSDNVSTSTSWDYTFPCADAANMPSFELLYGGYWMDVKADDYVIAIYGTTCSLCFSGYDGLDEWILGDAFMRGWYNIHDHTNNRMGFVPFSGSTKVKPTLATSTPTTALPLVGIETDITLFGLDAATFLAIVFIAGIGTAIVVGCTVFICYTVLFTERKQIFGH